MRVALAQTEPLWENKEGNFRAALSFLEQAREKQADLILFPEMSMTGFSMHPEKIGETNESPETLSFFREQAQEYGLYIGVGYVEYCQPKSFNRYAIISPEGKVLADYRKIHPFTFGTEAVHYAGGEELAFCRVKEFTVSPLICYDLRFPELFEIASERAEMCIRDRIPDDIAIDQVVIGSCTNGRMDDLRTAAEILKGRKVKKGLRCIVIPGTQKIYMDAMEEGLLKIFLEAGAVVSTPTCGPCLGGYMGILAAGERCVSTTNRNFVGRMGHVDSEVYLASPAVAAASAVTGRISEPAELGL